MYFAHLNYTIKKKKPKKSNNKSLSTGPKVEFYFIYTSFLKTLSLVSKLQSLGFVVTKRTLSLSPAVK